MGTFSSNAQQIADALLILSESMKEQLQPWNQLIVSETESELNRLYGNKLAAHFQTEDVAPGAGELAHVRTGSDNPRVLGYENGIRPHDIIAHHIALRFETSGDLLYRHQVHHPGTQGKHLGGELEASMGHIAETEWQDGISTIFANFDASI